MLAESLKLQFIFEKDVLHLVPLFQRPYVWTRGDQWEPLWNDIRQLSERLERGENPRPHFLGASVHATPKVPPGHIETRRIIDGQQRLTTLQLFLKAFEDIVADRGIEKYRQAISKMTRNNHPLSKAAYETFKVWPTNADREDFRWTMEAGSPSLVGTAYGYTNSLPVEVGRAIPDAYLYFHRVIDDWIGTDERTVADRIVTLYSAVRENVRIVVIDLDEDDDAQLIFETLNARGTPLLAADLVKNALLQEAEEGDNDPEQLYEDYWSPFDEDSWYWRTEIGRGHGRRHRIEIYLQHFLTLKTRHSIETGRLYPAYRDFVDSDASGSVEDRFGELARYGAIYRRIDAADVESPRARLALGRLATLDVGTAYPFLLELFARLEDRQDLLAEVLSDLEAFLVRRMVCRLSTRAYNDLFVDLLPSLDGSVAGIPGRVRRQLLSGDSEANRWPTDTEFHQAWTEEPLYNVLSRPRMRLLLEAVERGMRGRKAETAHVPSGLTIEHVMPIAWQAHWPLPKRQPTLEATLEREHLLHTIGNLTLLNKALNPSVSNGPWVAGKDGGKKAALEEHSVLYLNKALTKSARWTEQRIKGRAERLFKLATGLWPHPKVTRKRKAA